MRNPNQHFLSRRGFCLCCLATHASALTGAFIAPRQAYAEARGIVSLIKDSAATSPITTHTLRGGISVLEGSGGNIAVLTGPDGKVMIDAGISVSRDQLTKALAVLGDEPITHLVNTHWHFDHADGNSWLNSLGAKIIAQDNTKKYLSQVQRVADWDYKFSPDTSGRSAKRGILGQSRPYAQPIVDPPAALRRGTHRQRPFCDLWRGRHHACR